MGFPPAFLDELRARLPLAQVIGRKVKLIRRGREYLGLCPFHNEKTPSFSVNPDKGFYHCFGCGAHGDVVSFEMNASHLPFPEAVARLAAEAGIDLPVESPREREQAQRHKTLHQVMEAVCHYYQAQLGQPGGRAALDYLHRRGLESAAIARFRLGFAPDGRDVLARALAAQGTDVAALIEAGVLVRRDDGSSYDRFRGRVIFPIADARGRVIAFGGRSLGDGQPKYLNSPDTPLFNKGHNLYNLDQAGEAARAGGSLVACEGYMDVIALARAGFDHAVAPLGTALTESQIEAMWRYVDEPVLCFDGDAAGHRAAAKAADRVLPLLKPGKSLRFAWLPAGEDPDSLVRSRGAPAMQAVLTAAEPLIDVLWRLLSQGRPLDTPERRAALEVEAEERLGRIADRGVRVHYTRLVRERLRALWDAGRFGQGRKRPGRRGLDGRLPGAGRPLPPPAAAPMQERILLATVISHPALLDEVGERLGSLLFSDNQLDRLRQEVIKHHLGGGDLDSPFLLRYLGQCGLAADIESHLGHTLYELQSFTRPEASLDAARIGWEHAYKMYLQKEVRADAAAAEGRLAQDMTQRNFESLVSLTREQDVSLEDPSVADDRPLTGPAPSR